MASHYSPDHDACDLKIYEGRRSGGNWAMVIHFKRNLFSFLIAAALFSSVVDGQYDGIAIPPAQRYLQAVSSPPSPQAFQIQLLGGWLGSRRELLEPSSAPSSLYDSPPPPPSRIYDSPPPPPSNIYDSPPPPPSSIYDLSPSPESSHDAPSAPPSYSERSTARNGKKKTSIGIIIGPVVAGIAVLALIGVAVAWKYKKKPTKEDHEQPGGRDIPETPQRSPKDAHALLPVKGMVDAYSMEAHKVSPKEGDETAGERTTSAARELESHAASEVSSARTADTTMMVPEAARRFTYNEILSITKNFGWVVGEGGSSTVYYGQLPETGVKVAVKKLKEPGSQIGNLLKEIEILMRIHHRNLASLVGFYLEQDEIILVSEYMANGSLYERLKARAHELTWRKRLQIALDAAIGLEYLHTGCKPAVIHRDIKPANILLDENLQAKLADFGLSKTGAADGTECSVYQTRIAGTLGYIDPEYLQTETLTKKSDVYSFGVVLFELITGKPAIMITETNEKCNLTRWVMPMLMRGNIESLLDPLLKGRCNIQSVWEVAAIAKTATQDPAGRPDMPQIVSTLKAALSMETSWADMAFVSETMTSQSSFDEIPHNPVAR